MNKLKNKKGFFPLWLGMQEAICGVKPKVNLDSSRNIPDDQLPDLGLFIIIFFSFSNLEFMKF